MIEIYDDFGHPLFLTNLQDALRRKMPRSMVQVIIISTQGKYLIQKRAAGLELNPGMWDLSAVAHVMAGQSRMGAAIKALWDGLGLSGPRLKEVSALPYQDQAGAKLSASFFVSEPARATPVLNPGLSSDYMFLDRDELLGLSQVQPEIFTTELAWAVRSGWIFPGSDKRPALYY